MNDAGSDKTALWISKLFMCHMVSNKWLFLNSFFLSRPNGRKKGRRDRNGQKKVHVNNTLYFHSTHWLLRVRSFLAWAKKCSLHCHKCMIYGHLKCFAFYNSLVVGIGFDFEFEFTHNLLRHVWRCTIIIIIIITIIRFGLTLNLFCLRLLILNRTSSIAIPNPQHAYIDISFLWTT